MIQIHTQPLQARQWLERYRGKLPVFACVLGFTDTCLIPGISAAGKTPEDRQYTAIADAEFLANGVRLDPEYPLPPLIAGASPVYIARAIVAALDLPVYIFNAGLPTPPSIPHIDLDGMPAACLTTGAALPLVVVDRLYRQGLLWGKKLAASAIDGYIVIGECVVGGTTTALSLLTGLEIDAAGKVNSSHPVCNHQQKWDLVERGLAGLKLPLSPLELVAAIGDPMQIVVAGMTISASRSCGVLLAGGTQMLAVAALIQALELDRGIAIDTAQIVVGTTDWVANDRSGNTVALAELITQMPLISTRLSFARSQYSQLQVYERGFVKEGVGAGGLAIAASLYRGWGQVELLESIEQLLAASIEMRSGFSK
ncbi:nicotinate mononucleotide-dependent phosphoribosyltransferase CobT [Chamaesiphon sp. GL140_3_metabinner_50]|uniref:nicotinate mononucleotide-dependent phosphoribosyltransferase CobT n=1 Tax=Chamaesiphon sp. GL140_3_metabinner_50 TaxID=2970812 RepID=UPI0025D2F211|nr:TIGR00303 family protein [Chamaesiphon sp. GL140_3_metabinner_50]